jgi:hypothetical protein
MPELNLISFLVVMKENDAADRVNSDLRRLDSRKQRAECFISEFFYIGLTKRKE